MRMRSVLTCLYSPTGTPRPARSLFRTAGVAFLIIAAATTGVLAASGGNGAAKASEAVFLVQVMALILLGRLLGEAMQRIGQPSVMGQLIAGLILGPSVLGVLWPAGQHALFPSGPEQKAMLDGVAQIGVLMLLLLAGMETDLKLVRRVGRAAFSVSLTGIVLPFACGFALGEFIPDFLLPEPSERLIASLFLGTALSISSVKIVAMVVREMNFMRRNVGQVILASAVIDDTVGWIIIAITFSLAESGSLDLPSLARSIVGTLVFLAVSLTFGRRVVFWLIRWANDNLVSEVPVISVILLIMGAMALITDAIGVHTVLGAFVAGILVGESPILTRQIDMQLRGLIMGLFTPVFFGAAGLSADLTILADMRLLLLTGGLVLIASIGKFAGAFAGGIMGRLTARESLALACGMNARGSTEVIVATIGLSIGVLSQDLFTMIVAMAIITTMAMPPMLRWALGRLPLGAEEKARLEREEAETKGFLPKVERLLLAVDDSANARFAARLTGMIAGGRGRPTTVIHFGDPAADGGDTPVAEGMPAEAGPPEEEEEDTAEEAVKAAAKTTTDVEEDDEEKPRPGRVDVSTSKAKETPTEQTIAEEAKKGYDLMVIGIENTEAANGGFHGDVTRLAASFDGPLAVVAGRGDAIDGPAESPLRILVPVNGTEASRRAAEIAVAFARASHVPFTALYVNTTAVGAPDNGKSRRRVTPPTRTRRHEEAILKDVVTMAEHYGIHARTKVRVDVAPDEAILREAAIGRNNLIVMGVNRRPGDTLNFGDTAARLLEKGQASILFVTG
jgi:Kef-type K+ transport system membrane component KefB/nucleotide-binding universal stress UspA family protein